VKNILQQQVNILRPAKQSKYIYKLLRKYFKPLALMKDFGTTLDEVSILNNRSG
jgi:hypothetical protein